MAFEMRFLRTDVDILGVAGSPPCERNDVLSINSAPEAKHGFVVRFYDPAIKRSAEAATQEAVDDISLTLILFAQILNGYMTTRAIAVFTLAFLSNGLCEPVEVTMNRYDSSGTEVNLSEIVLNTTNVRSILASNSSHAW